jgi:predicted acylesterase/phospholipase RssA
MCYDTLCLSGGGINGLDIIGSLKYLNDNKIIKINNIKIFIGTSVGSLICILLVIGYKINFIIKIVYKLDFNKIKVDFDLDNLIENYGIDNGSRIISVIQTLLFNKINLYDLSFKDLYKRTGKNLKIIVVNLTKKKEELLSYETTPHMSIILAIRMSISIPLVFYPVKYNNNLYIDGGLLNNFGFNYCNPKKSIGICIDIKIDKNPDNLFDYIKDIMLILQKAVSHLNNINENMIIIESKSIFSSFYLDKEMKYKLIKNGYKKTKNITNNNINFFASKFINNLIDDCITPLNI